MSVKLKLTWKLKLHEKENLARSQEFLRAGELSENRGKNSIFFFFFFFDDKTTCWHYSGFLSRACSLTVIMITFFLYMPPWVMQKKTVHFSFTWSFKSAFLMFESRYKRNWTLYYEPKVSERGDSAPLLPTCKWRTLFSKKEHPI